MVCVWLELQVGASMGLVETNDKALPDAPTETGASVLYSNIGNVPVAAVVVNGDGGEGTESPRHGACLFELHG